MITDAHRPRILCEAYVFTNLKPKSMKKLLTNN